MPRSWIFLMVVAVLSGCGSKVNLYSQLDEQQANEMVALLLAAHIDADKEVAEGKNWMVKTDKASLPQAMETLRDSGYPREQFRSFGEIFKKDSFVSSPLEERARLVYGLSQELARTVSSIDGVLVARVHVALPEKDPLSERIRPASASVFVKHRTDADIANHVAQIKALVVNSVEGLPYENVTVTLFPAAPRQLSAEGTPPKPSLAAKK
jgi:type III secretion protein J